MTSFAKVETDIVTQVIVAEADFFETFIDSTPGKWIETDSNIRKQKANIGYTYDKANDVFISPKPYASWALDASFDWQPPTARPGAAENYTWNEDTKAWDEID
jgi:hypothetical protein